MVSPINIVKIKRLLLLTICVMIALMGYYIWRYNATKNGPRPVPIGNVSDADVVIQNVEFVEYSNDRQLWTLRAEEATVYSAQKERRGKKVTADFFGATGKSTHLTSDYGVINDITGNIALSDNVRATAVQEDTTLTTSKLLYTSETAKITSDEPVRIERVNMIITGDGLEADVDLTTIIVFQHVTTTLIKPETGETQAVIVSDKLKFDNPTQRAIYAGNVAVTQENTVMKADKMIVYIHRTATAGDGIERIETFGNVQITQADKVVTGEQGEYIRADQKAIINGSAAQQARAEDKIQHLIHYADTIEFLLATNKVHAKGNVSTMFESEGN